LTDTFIMFAGGQIGTVVGMPISGFLCAWNWDSVFYFFGKNSNSSLTSHILLSFLFSHYS